MFSKPCLLVVAAALAACHTPPPRPWLRYELDGPTTLSDLGNGVYGGDVFGADVRVSIHDPETRIKVVVENATDGVVTFRLGPDAGAPQEAIGEVLLRQLDGPTVGGPDMQSYAARQPLAVDGGWRATFFLDAPLGRPIKLGQYFVFSVVAENAAGERVRCLLPLVGKLGGTVPQRVR